MIEQKNILSDLIKVISSSRFSVDNEKNTQAEIERKIIESGIPYKREHHLDAINIPDFFIDGIAVEVKIKGTAKTIYRQCERYCKFDEVEKLVLVTNRSMGFPKEINGKPCYVINLGRAWL